MAWMIAEYLCEPCELRFEKLEERPAPTNLECPSCGARAERVISAPHPKTVWGSVDRGKAAEKPHPFALDTSGLADGMTMEQWRGQRRKMWHDVRWKRARQMVR